MSAGFPDFGYDLDSLFDRGLGDVELVSNHTLSHFSDAWWEAAANLLTKARRWFAAGDDDRARRLVDRAVALPYDTHEDAAPAALAAHTMLFDLVADELEESEITDPRWLDAAIAVLDSADEGGRFEMRDILASIRDDYDLGRPLERRIFEATRRIPDRTELSDMGPLPPEELALHVESILRATTAYEAALAATRDWSDEQS